MKIGGRIITIGLTPAWDMHCEVEGIDWGDHKTIQYCTKEPAGKSLNINKALACLGYSSIATGIWSRDDYRLMLDKLGMFCGFIDVKMAAVSGKTRTNITLEDKENSKHLHLRFPDELSSEKNLKKVARQLKRIVRPGDVCIVAGSLPREELFESTLEILQACFGKGAKVILDTNGRHFSKIVKRSKISLVSPNVDELSELVGAEVQNRTEEIVEASQSLLRNVDTLLVSRGKAGAMVISADAAYSCSLTGPIRQARCEVACGDHLLAGFIAGLKEYSGSIMLALEAGVKLATAHAWGLTDQGCFLEVNEAVEATTLSIYGA